MAEGSVHPFSSEPQDNGKAFEWRHVGATNGRIISGMGVMASLDGDTKWWTMFKIPTPLPSGTMELVHTAIANATSGAAKFRPKVKSVNANGGNYDTVTLTDEGLMTLTWATGDDDDFKELVTEVTDGVTAGQVFVVETLFETFGWTLAARSTWNQYLRWA